MKTREDKIMIKLDINIYFSELPFWTYIKKKSAHSLCGAWSFLLVHILLTPSCEAKPNTLKRPSPGIGFGYHMCNIKTCSDVECMF